MFLVSRADGIMKYGRTGNILNLACVVLDIKHRGKRLVRAIMWMQGTEQTISKGARAAIQNSCQGMLICYVGCNRLVFCLQWPFHDEIVLSFDCTPIYTRVYGAAGAANVYRHRLCAGQELHQWKIDWSCSSKVCMFVFNRCLFFNSAIAITWCLILLFFRWLS